MYSELDYAKLTANHAFLVQHIGNPIDGDFDNESIEQLKNSLKKLKHHDEFYTIMDLRTLTFTWTYGMEKVLKFDSSNWNHFEYLKTIHDDFRKLFLQFGALAYKILAAENIIKHKPLANRYIINIPMKRKEEGDFVWVKVMSMPLRVDKNGLMVEQFNAFTIVGSYDEMFLPLAPRIFLSDDSRSRVLEKRIFEALLMEGELRLDPIHLKILRCFYNLDQKLVHERELRKQGNARVPVAYSDVLNHLPGMSESMLKRHSAEIHKRIKNAYNVVFPNIYYVANFFKPYFRET